MTDLSSNAQNPKKVTGDQGSMEMFGIEDQIAAEEFEEAKTATRRANTLPFRIFVGSNPSTQGLK